jgi:aryl-alcohol dehydrogenase-like predicted oxidoreductase
MTNPPEINKRVLDEANFDKLAPLQSFAQEHDYAPGQLAIMWLLAKPWVSSVLSGPMCPDQLDLYFVAAEASLSAADVGELDDISSPTERADPLYLPFLRQESPTGTPV